MYLFIYLLFYLIYIILFRFYTFHPDKKKQGKESIQIDPVWNNQDLHQGQVMIFLKREPKNN